jgi:hypothetical protein
VALVIGGGNAQWPVRFVFKALEELEQAGKLGQKPKTQTDVASED